LGPLAMLSWNAENKKNARRFLWAALGAFAAVQVYFVRELIAALIVFAILFTIVALAVLAVFLVGRAGETALSRAGEAIETAHPERYWSRIESLSKRLRHRLRSVTAQ